MKLAVIASHPVQYYGPLFRELAKRIDVTVMYAHKATPREQGAAGFGIEFDWDVDLISGYDAVYLTNTSHRPNVASFFGCDTPDVFTKLELGRFDAVLVTGWNLKTYVQASVAAKRLNIPLLVRGDSQLVGKRSLSRRVCKEVFYPSMLRMFDVGLYVGQRTFDYFRHFRFPESRLFFSPHSVDAARFGSGATTRAGIELRGELDVPEGVKLVLFAGRLVPFKRAPDIVKAIWSLRQQGHPVEMLVAGQGEQGDVIRSVAAELKVPTHFLGFCNQSRMPSVYAASDLLVLSSDGGETWGLVANESLACGKPIVVSDACGCAPDLVGDCAVGRSYPMGDVSQLKIKIEEVLHSPPTLSAIRERSNRYSLSRSCEGIIEGAQYAVGRKKRLL